jgi:hypothetical protein
MATAAFTTVVDRSIGDPLTEAIWDDQLKDNINQLGGAHRNLLTNGGFEIWQRGTGSFTTSGAYSADRWLITNSGANQTVTKETSTIDGGLAALKCVVSSTNANVDQKLEDYASLRGRTLSLSIRAQQSASGIINVTLNDSAGGTNVVSSSTTGSYQTMVVSRTINAAATSVTVTIQISTGTVYLDNAMLVIGPSPAPYQPLHPQEDLARCQRYYEVTIVNYLGSAQGASHTMGQWLPFAVTKSGTPTITKNGTWAVTNCAQPSVGTAAATGLAVFTTSSAAGAVQFVGNSADDTVSAEHNP